MARATPMIDDPQDLRRLIYVSWIDGDNLSVTTQKKLMEHLSLSDVDEFDRQLEVVDNDPTATPGQETASDREMRDLATDFVAIFTTRYLATTKALAKAGGEPDLLRFLRRKCSDEQLAMWIVPVEPFSLRMIGFRSAAVATLDFPWWHGWRGSHDKVPLPVKDDDNSTQVFSTAIFDRVREILSHQHACPTCRLKPPTATP